jgi:hypothetical protein
MLSCQVAPELLTSRRQLIVRLRLSYRLARLPLRSVSQFHLSRVRILSMLCCLLLAHNTAATEHVILDKVTVLAEQDECAHSL